MNRALRRSHTLSHLCCDFSLQRAEMFDIQVAATGDSQLRRYVRSVLHVPPEILKLLLLQQNSDLLYR